MRQAKLKKQLQKSNMTEAIGQKQKERRNQTRQKESSKQTRLTS
jgi:hypothetical protein